MREKIDFWTWMWDSKTVIYYYSNTSQEFSKYQVLHHNGKRQA